MRHTLLLLCAALPVTHLLGQVTVMAAGRVPCLVRIRPMAAAGYDPGSEMLLRGTVTGAKDGILKVRLPFGVVRIQVGPALDTSPADIGQVVEVLASRCQDDRDQWFVARKVHLGTSTLVLRDARGVPVS
jgi:hypothetical protein